MNELKFNSQVCTTKIQSQRVLDLGLKPETADMILIHNIFSNTYEPLPKTIPTDTKCYIPAWSLHRLIEMLEIYLDYSPFTGFNDMGNVSLYDDLIDLVENMISKGMFYEEYLKQ